MQLTGGGFARIMGRSGHDFATHPDVRSISEYCLRPAAYCVVGRITGGEAAATSSEGQDALISASRSGWWTSRRILLSPGRVRFLSCRSRRSWNRSDSMCGCGASDACGACDACGEVRRAVGKLRVRGVRKGRLRCTACRS